MLFFLKLVCSFSLAFSLSCVLSIGLSHFSSIPPVLSLYISVIRGELEECWINARLLVRSPHPLGAGHVIGPNLSVPTVISIQPQLVNRIRSPWDGAQRHLVHIFVFFVCAVSGEEISWWTGEISEE